MGLQSFYTKLKTIVHLVKSRGKKYENYALVRLRKWGCQGFLTKMHSSMGGGNAWMKIMGINEPMAKRGQKKGAAEGILGWALEQGKCDQIFFNVSVKGRNNEA